MDITPSPATPPEAPSRATRYAKAGALVASGALAATALTGIAFGAGTPGPSTPAPQGNGYGAAPLAPQGEGPGMMAGMPGEGDPAGFGRHRGGGLGLGVGGNLLHGEGVVKDRTGATVTVRTQHGTVVSATAEQVVVKSEDGVTWTWPVAATTKVKRDGATITADKLQAGDDVRALGTVAGDVVTTKHIRALSPAKAAELKAKRDAMRQKLGNGPAPKGADPAPTTS